MANDLMKMIEQEAFNISAISKQMGLVVGELNEIKAEQNSMIVRMDGFEQRMTGYEERERISKDQKRRMKAAIHAKVNHLLGLEFSGGLVKKECMNIDKNYRGAFMRKCYLDARRYSDMGSSCDETYVKDYDAVMRYIENWEPECEYNGKIGARAYIEYLDDRRTA